MTVTLPDATVTSAPLGVGHAPSDPDAEKRAFWDRRLQRLTDIWQAVRAERDIAMYQLHQHGMPLDEIARRADDTPDSVADILTVALRDPNMADYPPGPLFSEYLPHMH